MSKNDDDAFHRAMRGVEPLEQETERVGGAPKRKKKLRLPPAERRIPRFEVRRYDDQLEGLVESAHPRQLRTLHRDAQQTKRPLPRIDLHGLTAEVAQEVILSALRRAREEGQRIVLIIHGRGLHSESGPILKERLTDWLIGAPAAHWVRAFRTAPPEMGGAGATLVRLERRKRQPGR
ncbi:MAG: Smr/MutS family protein [Acidobacteriota bacterium]